MIRKLNELKTNEEMLKLLHNNSKLYDNVVEDYQESIMFHVEEVLDCFNGCLSNYSIGFYQYCYIKVYDNKISEFCNAIINATDMYGFLNDEDLKKVEQLQELNNKLCYMDYENKQYDNLENKINDLTNEVVGIVNDEFDNWCDYDNETIEEYFLDFYFDERLDFESMYINDDGVLCEHIEYIKRYA
nr:MAG TPA: hypothetical protein [Caudoviricetes sp.]